MTSLISSDDQLAKQQAAPLHDFFPIWNCNFFSLFSSTQEKEKEKEKGREGKNEGGRDKTRALVGYPLFIASQFSFEDPHTLFTDWNVSLPP